MTDASSLRDVVGHALALSPEIEISHPGRSRMAGLSIWLPSRAQVSDPRIMSERTIASGIDLPHASPDAVVGWYGKALTEILSQLVPELGVGE